jgi:hypothetical protein
MSVSDLLPATGASRVTVPGVAAFLLVTGEGGSA